MKLQPYLCTSYYILGLLLGSFLTDKFADTNSPFSSLSATPSVRKPETSRKQLFPSALHLGTRRIHRWTVHSIALLTPHTLDAPCPWWLHSPHEIPHAKHLPMPAPQQSADSVYSRGCCVWRSPAVLLWSHARCRLSIAWNDFACRTCC